MYFSLLSRLLHYTRVLLYVYWNIEIIERKKESERAERFVKHVDLRVLMRKRDFNRVIQINSQGELGFRRGGITF